MIRYLVPLRNFLLKNFHLKATALLLAFLLWITINGEPRSEIGFKVPLEYRNLPKGIEVLEDAVNTIDVRLSASSSLIKRLEASDITAAIDLSNWSVGERTYSITAANIRAPLGVSITRITPNKVRLRFEPTQAKAVNIRPRIVGKPAEGHRIESVNCQPQVTQIEGPAAHIGTVQNVSTDSIDVNGRSENYKGWVHLFAEDPLVRFSSDQQVLVEVIIVPVKVGRS